MYNLKIGDDMAERLKKKAQAKNLDLAEYLRNLIAFSETLDDYSSEDTILLMRKSKVDQEHDLLIPIKHLKHG
jgi:hypothetical protein